jgi:hypothetical protein
VGETESRQADSGWSDKESNGVYAHNGADGPCRAREREREDNPQPEAAGHCGMQEGEGRAPDSDAGPSGCPLGQALREGLREGTPEAATRTRTPKVGLDLGELSVCKRHVRHHFNVRFDFFGLESLAASEPRGLDIHDVDVTFPNIAPGFK